jgi:hypothetical protein
MPLIHVNMFVQKYVVRHSKEQLIRKFAYLFVDAEDSPPTVGLAVVAAGAGVPLQRVIKR